MTSKLQRHSIVSFLQLSGDKSAWGVLFGLALLGVFLVFPAHAAVFTVNSPSDVVDANPGNGVCETAPGNGVCTLRAAVLEANALAGADRIILPPNTYLLTQDTELTITGDLIITGGGAAITIIDGNKSLRPDRGVLRINGGVTVNISGVTIRNGARTSLGTFGGGISNSGTLTLINSTVSGNSANDDGGGISNANFGTLTLVNCTVSGNSSNHDAGGIRNGVATLTLTNSTVSGNSAGSVGTGGGIHSFGTLTLTNSTVSGNSAGIHGGGIYNTGDVGTANLFNSTVTNNQADADLNGFGFGGGVFNSAGRTFNFQNTIIAENRRVAAIVPGFPPIFVFDDCAGTLNSNGNNLMTFAGDCAVNGGGVTEGVDPQLGPLQNNGGPTQTHVPLPGSPAIDAGNSSGCRDQFGALLLKDQRGFRRAVDGSRDGTATCDIGAVEFGSGAGVTFNSDVDFDGDGRNDIAVYREGMWFVVRSFDGGMTATPWGGLPQDVAVPGDYDGDGKTDLAVYAMGPGLSFNPRMVE
jgi:CSLREA domain-containing protein